MRQAKGRHMIFEVHQSDEVSEFLDFESIQQQAADQVAVEELQDFATAKTTSKGIAYQSSGLRSL